MTVSDQAGRTAMEPLRAKSGWIIALGVVYLIAGAVALSSVAMATVISVFLVGIMMLVSGIAEVINAFQVKSWGKFILWLLLGASLIASGITKIVLGFNMKAGASWGVVVLAGVITLLVGLVIVSHWPWGSLYILGIFLAVDLIVTGAGWISIGLGLKTRS